MANRRLGRGLKALLTEATKGAEAPKAGPQEVEIAAISTNRFQPRGEFDSSAIASLAESIRLNGVLQPILVRDSGGGEYELIAGERRLRAARELGLKTIPATIKADVADRSMLEMALLENLQREDLNPIEKAKGFKRLVEEFQQTHDAIAEAMALDRSTVANTLRLLELPLEIQEAVSRGTVTMGHARALLGLPTPKAQMDQFQRVVKEGLSVRATEDLVRKAVSLLKAGTKKPKGRQRPVWLNEMETDLQGALSAKVKITRNATGKGKLLVEFASDSELERISKLIKKL